MKSVLGYFSKTTARHNTAQLQSVTTKSHEVTKADKERDMLLPWSDLSVEEHLL